MRDGESMRHGSPENRTAEINGRRDARGFPDANLVLGCEPTRTGLRSGARHFWNSSTIELRAERWIGPMCRRSRPPPNECRFWVETGGFGSRLLHGLTDATRREGLHPVRTAVALCLTPPRTWRQAPSALAAARAGATANWRRHRRRGSPERAGRGPPPRRSPR